jgi:hypothetical protein
MCFAHPLPFAAVLAGLFVLSSYAFGQSAYLHADDSDTPSKLQVDTQPLYSEGQIQYFGGPLQSYLSAYLSDPSRDTHLPFGANAVLPIANDRVEFFGGIGGVYTYFQSSYAHPDSWLTQTTVGSRMAVDPGRHVWIGVSGHYMASFADSPKQRAYGTADLTYRFGH